MSTPDSTPPTSDSSEELLSALASLSFTSTAPDEIEAVKYHTALVQAEGGSHYTYDSELTAEKCRKHGVRDMGGRFVCSPCNRKISNIWGSGVICTELYLSRDNHTYRAVIHAQQCKRCNKYGKLDLNVEKYVDKVLDTFALWRGLRDAKKPDDPHASRGPHDKERCHGCKKGVCNKNRIRVFDLEE